MIKITRNNKKKVIEGIESAFISFRKDVETFPEQNPHDFAHYLYGTLEVVTNQK